MSRIFLLVSFLALFFVYPFLGRAQQLADVKISLQLKQASLSEVMLRIEALTPFKFLAKAEVVEAERNITIDETNQTLTKILEKIVAGRNLSFTQTGLNILLKRVAIQPEPGDKKTAKGQQHALYGTIKSRKTGETIIGATLSVAGSSSITTSNDYGFYSLTLAEGEYRIDVTAVGSEVQQIPVSLFKSSKVDILMDEDSKLLETVTVTSQTSSRGIRNTQMSVEKINVQETKNIPVLLGERDILKTMQLLPGVKSAGEGNSGFFVRGGGADQNLILLDEAPVYNSSHLLGFFSTFNSDAIKSVTLYKGGMPAQYGGRLSSVVDIKMNDGNNQDLAVSGGIGLIASRLNLEGPLQKDRSSFLLSGRRTYADVFIKLFGDSSLKKTRLYFYDLNAKASFELGEKDKLYISGYFGRDVLSQSKLAGINWGNATGTFRWNHIFNKKVFSNTSLIFSNYDYKINIESESTDYQILSRIRDWNLKEELQFYANARNTINLGVNLIYHSLTPGEISLKGNNSLGLPDRHSLENAVYASNSWKATEKFSLTYGLRLSAFSVLGKGDYYNLDGAGMVKDTIRYKRGEVVKTYINPEPRVALSYLLDNTSSLKASYARNTQNLHLLSNSTSSSPTDKWVASTNIIKPEVANQVAVGYYKNLKSGRYELSVESYYKTMENQIDYRNGAEVFSTEPIETQLLYGRGRAYGVEGLLKKKSARFNGWVSYTLSKTERKIAGINNGAWYNARQDRTHDVAVVGMYQLNKRWSLSANWIFYTGDAVTYPSGKYKVDGEVYFYYSERNGYRLPTYHRLDIGATRQLKKKKRFTSEINFSLFNAYGRSNVYQINFQESETDPDKTEAVKTSLFNFVPSVSYNFKF